MSEFSKYIRTNVAEMRQVTESDIFLFNEHERIFSGASPNLLIGRSIVSISDADRRSGSPRVGDMIARNLEDHCDLWLVAEKYFKDNFKLK